MYRRRIFQIYFGETKKSLSKRYPINQEHHSFDDWDEYCCIHLPPETNNRTRLLIERVLIAVGCKIFPNNLSKEIKNVSLRAYLQKGKTMDYDSIGKLFGNTDNFKRLRHMVFGRAGQPCFICGDTVIKLFSSSRRVYLCTTCQDFSG